MLTPFLFKGNLFLSRIVVCTILVFLFLPPSLTAQHPENVFHHKQCYKNAFQEINLMLEGKKPLLFKRAVFLMENAYWNDSLSYEQFNKDIAGITSKLRQLIKDKNLEKYKTSGNWAAFTYMVDSIPANNFHPFSYDFKNFIAQNDPSVCFVTKLLHTQQGNCVSLPFLYKILAEDIGASASLALAPLHCFIKHKDEAGKWVNLEMTSGSFARDEWIIQQSGVTVEQIKSGIYMNALSQKESIALVLKDLVANYQLQFGSDDFDIKAIQTALRYYPTGILLYLTKFEHYRQMLLLARSKKDAKMEESCNKVLFGLDNKLADLAYKDVSVTDYKDWIKENEKSKTQQNRVTLNK